MRTDGSSYSVTTENGAGNIWERPATARANTSLNGTSNTSGLPRYTIPPAVFPENVTMAVPALPAPQIGNASKVVISEVRFDALGDDRMNLNGEWVRLTNTGDSLVLLNGWTLSDKTGSFSYIFPADILPGGSSVTLYTGSGIMNDTALFMGYNNPVWGNTGDVAILRDFKGNIIDKRSQEEAK